MMNERLDIKNFIHDSMDTQVLRGLVLKSRHRLLIPLLVLNQYKLRFKEQRTTDTSFLRNLGERTDNPTFSIEDAVSQ